MEEGQAVVVAAGEYSNLTLFLGLDHDVWSFHISFSCRVSDRQTSAKHWIIKLTFLFCLFPFVTAAAAAAGEFMFGPAR